MIVREKKQAELEPFLKTIRDDLLQRWPVVAFAWLPVFFISQGPGGLDCPAPMVCTLDDLKTEPHSVAADIAGKATQCFLELKRALKRAYATQAAVDPPTVTTP